jgi:hypothetical protein
MERMSDAVCLFELQRKIVGQLFIPIVNENSIVVNYLFYTPNIKSDTDEVTLPINTVRTGFQAFRALAECPICFEFYCSLYFKDRWACGGCLGLHYRRQLIDKDVARWEKRDALHKQLQHGRPKGMHNATYSKLKEELSHCEGLLDGKRRKYASDAHDLIICARWVPATEVDLWSPYYTVRGGLIVRCT